MALYPSLPKRVTYSPAFTVVPTYGCFNRCSYCNFRTDPELNWLDLATAQRILAPLTAQGICEILILSGEVHPQSARREDWIRHILHLCQLALDLGFLPHTNVGPLSWSEMEQIGSVNASMGLMLEQMTPALLRTVHRHAPSKDPTLRLQQLQQAGQLRIPFTTGLLLGIGETEADRVETVQTIAAVHSQYGHIQEVIIQPHRPEPHRQDPFAWECSAAEMDNLLLETVQMAKALLPTDIAIQIPPNLTQITLHCVEAGARDLGGIGPKDHVNPDYPHPTPDQLQTRLGSTYLLQARLPVYPQYFDWVPSAVQPVLESWLANRILTST